MRDYCDAQAGFWLNSKFWSKFSRKPLSGIEDQKVPPSISENFRFGMTKVYSRIPPISENFRFGMTKVYSGIPPLPPFRKTSDLGWPKFTPEYPPPNKNCQRVQVREFQNAESYYMWRLYPTRKTTRCFKLLKCLSFSHTVLSCGVGDVFKINSRITFSVGRDRLTLLLADQLQSWKRKFGFYDIVSPHFLRFV